MTDRILIEGLAVETVVGVFDWERRVRQSLVVDVELRCDLRPAGASDRLAATVDYKALSDRIRRHLEASRYRLVETLAESAAELCLADERVQVAVVTVHKSGALRHARDVAITVERARGEPSGRPPHTALVGVGSNVDPVDNVRRALDRIHAHFGAIRVSPAYVTEAVGAAEDSPDFLNLVVELRTELAPDALNAWLHDLETESGRRRGEEPAAPRTLDLDLLLYDDVVRDGEPRLPHPQVESAAFVLVPLADLTPETRHPVLGITIGELRGALPALPDGIRPSEDVVF